MKERDNVQITVSIEVKQVKSYCESMTLAAASRSVSGTMEVKDMGAHVKALVQEAKAQVIDSLDSLNSRDEAETEAEEKNV
jgi:hypothetical protein